MPMNSKLRSSPVSAGMLRGFYLDLAFYKFTNYSVGS